MMLSEEEARQAMTRIEEMVEGILGYLENFKKENPDTEAEDFAVAAIDAATIVAIFVKIREEPFTRACQQVYQKNLKNIRGKTND
jgi:hypothetical protein